MKDYIKQIKEAVEQKKIKLENLEKKRSEILSEIGRLEENYVDADQEDRQTWSEFKEQTDFLRKRYSDVTEQIGQIEKELPLPENEIMDVASEIEKDRQGIMLIMRNRFLADHQQMEDHFKECEDEAYQLENQLRYISSVMPEIGTVTHSFSQNIRQYIAQGNGVKIREKSQI